LNEFGRNSLLGNRKKIAKFLMRTFTYRSTFLYACSQHACSQEIDKFGVEGGKAAENVANL
jgi:hypothetical protein